MHIDPNPPIYRAMESTSVVHIAVEQLLRGGPPAYYSRALACARHATTRWLASSHL
jgi:hypothetical protein